MSNDCHVAVTCSEESENLQGFHYVYSALYISWEEDFDGKMGVSSVWVCGQSCDKSSSPFTEVPHKPDA